MQQLKSHIVIPHDDSRYELDTQDMAIITMQPHPSTPVAQTPVSNPYSWAGYMDPTTTPASSDVEWQVSPHEVGSDVTDSQDIPLPDS